MTNNMARLLGWFSKDKDPFKFTLSDLASVEKLQGLAQLFVDCKVRGETRHKYFQTITGFIKAVGKSKYKQTHGHLMSVLDDVKEEAEVQKARASAVKGKERMQKPAKMALQQDDSLEQLKAFTKQVDTTLKDVVRGIFKECMKDKKKRVSDSDLRVVNVFWMCQAIKWGQRPGAVTGMDKMCYKRAKASEPSTTYGGLQAVGPCRFLVTSDHKTGSHELAFIPFPMKEEWSWLEFYYTYMRPSPKDQSAMKLLFRNSEGSKIGNATDNIKIVLPRYGIMNPPSATNVRHMVVTAAFQSYERDDRDKISTALCHNPSTGLKHYVDDKTEKVLKGLGLIRGLVYSQEGADPIAKSAVVGTSVVAGSSKVVTSVTPVEVLESNRPISPAESTSSDGSAGVRARTGKDARNALISECLSITTSKLPSIKEWNEALSANADRFPECVGANWENVRESMRYTQNKLRARQLVDELGRRKFSEGAREGLKKELEKRSWFSLKCLELTVQEYSSRCSNDRRPKPAETVTSSSLITPSVAKGITNQDWPLAKKSANDKGRCLIAQNPIKAGTVVVDYHGKLEDYRTGKQQYDSDKSEGNRYMFYVEHGGNKYWSNFCIHLILVKGTIPVMCFNGIIRSL
ncbi:MAG: hypothetical protein AB2693_29370 [Candidatus Thiodiazotropha sp.]